MLITLAFCLGLPQSMIKVEAPEDVMKRVRRDCDEVNEFKGYAAECTNAGKYLNPPNPNAYLSRSAIAGDSSAGRVIRVHVAVSLRQLRISREQVGGTRNYRLFVTTRAPLSGTCVEHGLRQRHRRLCRFSAVSRRLSH